MRRLLGTVVLLAGSLSFGNWSPQTRAALSQAVSSPPGASVSARVQVPASMRWAPFDVDRYLNVPPNFSIVVLIRGRVCVFTSAMVSLTSGMIC